MIVRIINDSTNKVIAEVRVTLKGLNYKESPIEFHDKAWASAVEDKIVNSNDRNDHRFEIE